MKESVNMPKKLLTLFAAGAMTMALAACGNENTTSHKSADHARSEKVVKHSSSVTKSESSAITASSQSGSTTTSSKNAAANYSVAKSNGATSSKVKSNQTASTRSPMTAQDAKDIVKEHLLAVINDAGINGKPKPNVPSMDEIDSYTTTQNGMNDWTVSGNGHTYHVTATSVTEE